MNLLLFGFALVLFSFNVTYKVEDTLQFFDLLPDFVGYLILWFLLEKRRISKKLNGLYTAVAVMTVVSFLFFLGQIQVFLGDLLSGDLIVLKWILNGLNYVMIQYGDGVLLVAVLMLGWLMISMLEYWGRTNQHILQQNICKAGLVLCGLTGLCHIGGCLIILPFSWHWISYPLSLLALAAAWFVMKDCPAMVEGSRELVEERRFGIKKKNQD